MKLFLFGLLVFSSLALGEDCQCTDSDKQQELSYLRGAFRTAWQQYAAANPWAGRGWRGNALQSSWDIINYVAKTPGRGAAWIINGVTGQKIVMVKPGPDFGVRCQQVYDGMYPLVMAELQRTGHRFRCWRIAQIIQDGVNGSAAFNHVYFGVVSFDKPAGAVSREMSDIQYFDDPWSDGIAALQAGIGYTPAGAWMGKSVDLGSYQGKTMPGEDGGAACAPASSCTLASLPGKWVFMLDSTTGTPAPGYAYQYVAYTFDLQSYLTQMAGWDYASPFQGNPYGNLFVVPVTYDNNVPSRLSDYAGGSWRVVQYLATSNDNTWNFTDWSATVVATGSLAPNSTLLNAPATVDRWGTSNAPSDSPTGIVSMSARTALEVTCNGSWPTW